MSRFPLLALVVTLSLSRLAAAMDWVLYSSVRTCPGIPISTGNMNTMDYIIPATLPTEPRRCLIFGPSNYFYLAYLDATKTSVGLNQCPTRDCSSQCSFVEAGVRWEKSPSQRCSPVFANISSNAVLTIGDMENGLAASGAAGILGDGRAASAYYLQLLYVPEANCVGSPVMGGMRYLFETCSRINVTSFASSNFTETSQDFVTHICTDEQCSIGCQMFFTGSKPVAKGSPPVCSVDSTFSRLRFEGKALTSSSRFQPQLPQAVPRKYLSAGDIAGIVVAGVFVIGGVAFLLIWRQKRSADPRSSTSSSKTINDDSLDHGRHGLFQRILGNSSSVKPSPSKPDKPESDPELEGKASLTPPSYQEAQALSQQSIVVVSSHDDERFGVMEITSQQSENHSNQHYGVMEINNRNALDDIANQQYGVMEANYPRRTA
ncbi:hypothetical protein BC831DRAFT_445438 [Entophlyctis helioformis]|nr:hypothetical protein BC831DRAFT_445438 [Entophlyctis helioformis]